MPEPTTETTPTTPAETTTPATTEQGAVGATTAPAPSQKEGEQTTPDTQVPPVTPAAKPTKLTSEEVQKRIDRMYARLQEEHKRRMVAEARTTVTPQTTPTGEEGETVTPAPGLTQADVEAVLERKETEKKFMASEMRVFEQHTDALNEDGSFNMDSQFVKRYIEVGKKNPMLAIMENGPEMAAAMVDKELHLDYKKGRTDEATRSTQAANSFTTSSTTVVPPNIPTTQLSETQKKVARRMGMTDAEYIAQQETSKVKQKSWDVKR